MILTAEGNAYEDLDILKKELNDRINAIFDRMLDLKNEIYRADDMDELLKIESKMKKLERNFRI